MNLQGRTSRLPSLDGLRAMSILFVLVGHVSNAPAFMLLAPRIRGSLAGLGVRVFFVISGFLITTLLLAENDRYGTISLRNFYFRRTMRIFPPFYAYVAIIALAAAAGLVQLRPHDVLAAVTYTVNYHHDRAWYLGHAWSLAVEEQFYLVWPFVFCYLGVKRAALVCLATLAVSPLLRFGLLILAPGFRAGIGETFPTVADAIATGCLLACYRESFAKSPRWLTHLQSAWGWVLPAAGILAAFAPGTKVNLLVGQTVTNIGVAVLIERVVRFPTVGVARPLNWRPVVYLGTLSYSLYLWQQPFMAPGTAWPGPFPSNLVAAFGCALASFYLIERPALRLRARMESARRRTHPSLDLSRAAPEPRDQPADAAGG
jgi:peptidoglycan/LPS O-acetylase OafA/YrhL